MKNKKKIKLVVGINSFIVGGEKKFINILKGLEEEKFDIHLITLFQHTKNELYYLLPKHVTVHKFNFSGFRDFSSWVQVYKCLRDIGPDVVLSVLFFSNTVFRALKPLVGYTVIASESNTYVDKTQLQILVDRALSHVSYRIIAVSETVAEFTSQQEKIPREKFVVIHNGVDLEAIDKELAELPPKKDLKERLGFSDSDKLTINVARLVPQKNHELLIRAFVEFSKNNLDYKLIIVGPGNLKLALERLVVDLNASDRIQLLGVKENVTPYYAMSDFLVSTSEIEGLSNAYLEAMACGLPIVATKTAGTDELIRDGENGFFITDSSISAAVEGMKKMASVDIADFARAARETAKQFDIKKTVQKYERLLERAVS